MPPIIWRVSASRTRVQHHVRIRHTYTHNSEAWRGRLSLSLSLSLSPQMRDMAVAAFHGVRNRIYMATCRDSERDSARLFPLSGNRRSNLPRNCKVTLRVKFIRGKRQPTRPCPWHELRGTLRHEKKTSARCQAVSCCQATQLSLFLFLLDRRKYCCLQRDAEKDDDAIAFSTGERANDFNWRK